MISSVRVWGSVAALFGTGWTAVSQAAPPSQYHVTDFPAEPLRAPQPAAFDAGSEFTMEGWVFLTEASPRAWVMGKAEPINGGAGGAILNFGLLLDDAGTTVRYSTNDFQLVATAPLTLRRWTHLAVTLAGGTTRLYVDGVVVASRENSPAILALPANAFGIGTTYDDTGIGSPGEAARAFGRQFRFWSIARTAIELAEASSQTVPTNRAGLVAAWPLDEDWGTTVRDVSGHGRHLTRASSVGGMRLGVLEAGPFFTKVTTPITHADWATPSSLATVDFDSDGDQDLIAIQTLFPPTDPGTPRRPLAFRNDGGTFIEDTDRVLGSILLIGARRTISADFNRDGREDLFIADNGTDTLLAPGGQSRLFLQSADGRLVDESNRLPQRLDYTHDADAADIDGDGDLDILMVNYIQFRAPRIYVNDGNANFTYVDDRMPADVAAGATENPSGVFVDLNRDGFPDVILGGIYYAPNGANSSRPNLQLMNDGTGRFGRDPAFVIPDKLYFEGVTPESVAADFDGDGSPDVLLSTDVGAVTPGLQLLLNDGAGHLRDETDRIRLRWAEYEHWHSEIHVQDFNADGRPDLALRTNASNYSPVLHNRTLMLNRGDAYFVDASDALIGAMSSGLGVNDFNGDGLPDLLSIYGNEILLYRAERRLELSYFADVRPTITTQPVSQTVGQGGTVTLLATAIGAPRPTLQWRRDGVDIPGATGEWLTLSGATAETAGAFTLAASNAAGTTVSGVANVAVTEGGPRLVNLSTRANAGSGEATLIVGFAVAGTGSKTLLIRGIGPALGDFGVSSFVADPSIQLFSGSSQIGGNDNWSASLAADFAQVGAFSLVTGSKDAALKVTLTPGSYTIHLRNPGPVAEALVEVYDLSKDPGTQLSNLSCRLSLAAGENVVVGSVLEGGSRNVLVRDIGPGLGQYGLTGFQPDPRLQVFSGSNAIATNDDWVTTLESDFATVGAFPLPRGSKDAAVKLQFGSGRYTVHATGAQAGVALVELYALP